MGFGIAYAHINRSDVNSVLVFILYSLHLLTIFANFPFSLRLHHRQSTPPPTPEYAVPLVWTGMRKNMTASPPNRQTRPIWWWRRTPSLSTYFPTTAPPGTHSSYAYKASAVTAAAPSTKVLIQVKGLFIHLHGLKNIRWSSTLTSSSDAAYDSDDKTVTSRSSASEQRQLGREGIWIPDRGRWSDPTPALDAAVSLPPLPAASVRPLSASFPSSLLSSSARLRLSIFCRHFHPHQTPCILSVVPLSVLLSGPLAAIIYPSPQNLFLPLICAISAIFYPYTPPNPSLSISLLYIYIYIYISPLTNFLSPISHNHSLYLYISLTY